MTDVRRPGSFKAVPEQTTGHELGDRKRPEKTRLDTLFFGPFRDKGCPSLSGSYLSAARTDSANQILERTLKH